MKVVAICTATVMSVAGAYSWMLNKKNVKCDLVKKVSSMACTLFSSFYSSVNGHFSQKIGMACPLVVHDLAHLLFWQKFDKKGQVKEGPLDVMPFNLKTAVDLDQERQDFDSKNGISYGGLSANFSLNRASSKSVHWGNAEIAYFGASLKGAISYMNSDGDIVEVDVSKASEYVADLNAQYEKLSESHDPHLQQESQKMIQNYLNFQEAYQDRLYKQYYFPREHALNPIEENLLEHWKAERSIYWYLIAGKNAHKKKILRELLHEIDSIMELFAAFDKDADLLKKERIKQKFAEVFGPQSIYHGQNVAGLDARLAKTYGKFSVLCEAVAISDPLARHATVEHPVVVNSPLRASLQSETTDQNLAEWNAEKSFYKSLFKNFFRLQECRQPTEQFAGIMRVMNKIELIDANLQNYARLSAAQKLTIEALFEHTFNIQIPNNPAVLSDELRDCLLETYAKKDLILSAFTKRDATSV